MKRIQLLNNHKCDSGQYSSSVFRCEGDFVQRDFKTGRGGSRRFPPTFVNISSYLADIDPRVFLIVSPVTESQAKFLLAVLSAQFHLLF